MSTIPDDIPDPSPDIVVEDEVVTEEVVIEDETDTTEQDLSNN